MLSSKQANKFLIMMMLDLAHSELAMAREISRFSKAIADYDPYLAMDGDFVYRELLASARDSINRAIKMRKER